MKIGVWILSEYKPQTGGGFSLYDKLIQSIDNYQFSDEIEICFIGHNLASRYNFKKPYLCVHPLSILFSKLVSRVSHKIKFLNNRGIDILKKNNIDVIFYPVQGFKKVNNFPFVTANWDIGHKDTFAFPEVAMNGTFEYREKWYGKEMHKALMIFAESEAGKEELVFYTRCNPDRVQVVPLFAGGVVDVKVDEANQKQLLTENNLVAEQYFFYPAQFWAHKNHYNLLLAFKELVKKFPDYKLVLTGSDKGNKKYIQETTKEFGLEAQVRFLGFISSELMFTLYRNATAMVMPSLMDSANMPLLEARLLNCPVICSDLKGHVEMMGDGALYVDATNHSSIASAMKKLIDKNERNNILAKANQTLSSSIFNIETAVEMLDKNFAKLKSIRKTWGQNDKIF